MGQVSILNNLLGAPAVETWLFYLLATLAVCLTVGVLTDRVVIRSGFTLIGTFGTISGIFLLLSAQFLALAQIMIYAVGITLMVVIALMLTNPRLESEAQAESETEKLPPLAAFIASWKGNLNLWVAIISFVTIYSALLGQRWPVADQNVTANVVQALGAALVTDYAIPFEFSSILLLAALMGAIMLAKGEPREREGEREGEGNQVMEEAKKQENNLALQR